MESSLPPKRSELEAMFSPGQSPKQTPLWQLILFGLIGAVVVCGGYVLVQQKIEARKEVAEAAKAKADAEALPHKQAQAMIAELLLHSTALPDCPLIYPLLDAKGKVNPLGSYLSYLAMNQASFVPDAVFCTVDPSKLFDAYGLFDPNSPFQQSYYKQLPYSFQNAKDLADGKIVKVGSGYRISLRFHGTKPEKKFSKLFPKKKLHLAIGWMASCLQAYMGFRPTAEQAAYRDKPIFVDDTDLQRCARLPSIFLNGGSAIVMGYDKILAKNPENPYLFSKWQAILEARGEGSEFTQIQAMLQKHPDSHYLSYDYLSRCFWAGKYDESLKVCMKELMRDNNNGDMYEMAIDDLWYKHCKEEAIQLAQAWTKLHPENTDAWLQLKDSYGDWAADIRGEAWEPQVSPDVKKVMIERATLGLQALQVAAKLVPDDCRVWSKYMSLGNYLFYDHATMEGYFQKMRKLNAYRTSGYEVYSDYLWPQRSGSIEEVEAFDRKYDQFDPGLYSGHLASMWRVFSNDYTVAGRKQFLADVRTKMDNYGSFKDYEKSAENQLTLNPAYIEVWGYYIEWELYKGRSRHIVEFAKKISDSNPELKSLYPTIWLKYIEVSKWRFLPDPDECWAFDQKRDIVQRCEQAYQELIDLEPENELGWNNLAFYAYKHRDMRVADRALKEIDDRWMGQVWPKDIFNAAKALDTKCLDCAGTGAESCGAPGCIHGYVRCPNHCLQVEDGEWLHEHYPNHDDSDIWKEYGYVDENGYSTGRKESWSQAHVGHLIKYVDGKGWTDTGVCPLCHGTGWIPCPVCHAKDKCKTCKGTGLQVSKKAKIHT